MRKILPVLLFALALAAAGSAFAQLDFDARSFYGQGMVTLPTGDFGDYAGTGIGLGVGLRVPYSPQLDFRGEIGYVFFGGESIDDAYGEFEYSYGMLPLTVLGEYRLQADAPGYFLGGLGLSVVRSSWEYTPTGAGIALDDDDSNTELTLTLGGGYDLNEQVSVEGRLNLISDTNYISVHGTYAF